MKKTIDRRISVIQKPLLIGWLILVFIAIVFLSFHFFAITDDIEFASVIKNHLWDAKQIVTVHGVNGRYLGNTLGILLSYLDFTSFRIVKVLFDIIFMSAFFLIAAKTAAGEKSFLISFFFISVCLLGSNAYHFYQFYGFSADFSNYLLPLFLFLINYNIVKDTIQNGHQDKKRIAVICLIAFLNCLFVEHITIYILVCSIGLLIYSVFNKKLLRTAVPLLLCTFLGTIFMFSYPLVYKDNSPYRESFFSEGFAWLFNNIFNNSLSYLFDNCFLVAFICIVLFFVLVRNTKGLWKLIGTISITLILMLSGLCSLCNYFGDWSNTPLSVLTDGRIIALLSVLFLGSIGIVLFFYLPKENRTIEMIILYGSIWFIAGMLSFVSPIAARTFMITYVFLSILTTKIWLSVSEGTNVFRLLLSALCVAFCVPYGFMLCKSYRTAYKVEQMRIEAIETQMELGAEEITIPDHVNFADSSGFSSLEKLYYYETPGDFQINLISYAEWEEKQ